jgi:hypothetical protein
MSVPAIPLDATTARLARRLVWFESEAEALADPVRMLAYAFAHGRASEIATLRGYVGDEGLRAALRAAPPGIIDGRSWAYWHVMLDMLSVPPLPERRVWSRPPSQQSPAASARESVSEGWIASMLGCEVK